MLEWTCLFTCHDDVVTCHDDVLTKLTRDGCNASAFGLVAAARSLSRVIMALTVCSDMFV